MNKPGYYREYTISSTEVDDALHSSDPFDRIVTYLHLTKGEGVILAETVKNFMIGGCLGGVYYSVGGYMDVITVTPADENNDDIEEEEATVIVSPQQQERLRILTGRHVDTPESILPWDMEEAEAEELSHILDEDEIFIRAYMTFIESGAWKTDENIGLMAAAAVRDFRYHSKGRYSG